VNDWELATSMYGVGTEVDTDDLFEWLIDHLDSAMEMYFLSRRHVRRFDFDHTAQIVRGVAE